MVLLLLTLNLLAGLLATLFLVIYVFKFNNYNVLLLYR